MGLEESQQAEHLEQRDDLGGNPDEFDVSAFFTEGIDTFDDRAQTRGVDVLHIREYQHHVARAAGEDLGQTAFEGLIGAGINRAGQKHRLGVFA